MERTGAWAGAMGSEEMEGREMTFLVVLFGAGGGADGRLAILGIPVEETTRPLVSLGSAGAATASLTAGLAGFAAGVAFAALVTVLATLTAALVVALGLTWAAGF